jgi:hypothetical protein
MAGGGGSSSGHRHSLQESTVFGILMNTRGLTEPIVLNIGRDLRVLPSTLFTMLVIMALVTTLLTGPLLRLADPRGELSEPELRGARAHVEPTEPLPQQPVLVASDREPSRGHWPWQTALSELRGAGSDARVAR